MIADKQTHTHTDRHAHRNAALPYRGRSNKLYRAQTTLYTFDPTSEPAPSYRDERTIRRLVTPSGELKSNGQRNPATTAPTDMGPDNQLLSLKAGKKVVGPYFYHLQTL